MVVVACPVVGCSYVTADQDPTLVNTLLQLHSTDHGSERASSGPKLTRPTVNVGVSQEVWNAFVRRWEAYRSGSGISTAAAAIQLFQCAEQELADLLLKSNPDVTSRQVEAVLEAMRVLAVIPVARGVVRAEFMQMKQKNDENFRLFAARVRGKAETCDYKVVSSCVCGEQVTVNYTEEEIRDVLLAGISDSDIRREALSAEGLQNRTVNDIISFVEGREMATKAISASRGPTSLVSTMSSFKRESNVMEKIKASDEAKSHSAKCPDCGKAYALFSKGTRGWNHKPCRNCFECWRATSSSVNAKVNISEQLEPCVTMLGASQISTLRPKEKVCHQVYVNGRWHKANFPAHPKFTVRLNVEHSKFVAKIEAIADTGAQPNLFGYADFLKAGFFKSVLSPVSSQFCAANENPLHVVGAFRGVFSGRTSDGQTIVCHSMVYVSDSVTGFFISKTTLRGLGVIDSNFPKIGAYTVPSSHDDTEPNRSVTVAKLDAHRDYACKCPQRSAIPDRPRSLPFEPLPENIGRMRAWLLNRYASSTFNVCPHRPLHQMAGPQNGKSCARRREAEDLSHCCSNPVALARKGQARPHSR